VPVYEDLVGKDLVVATLSTSRYSAVARCRSLIYFHWLIGALA
jgi:hypothetical protein